MTLMATTSRRRPCSSNSVSRLYTFLVFFLTREALGLCGLSLGCSTVVDELMKTRPSGFSSCRPPSVFCAKFQAGMKSSVDDYLASGLCRYNNTMNEEDTGVASSHVAGSFEFFSMGCTCTEYVQSM